MIIVRTDILEVAGNELQKGFSCTVNMKCDRNAITPNIFPTR